MTSARDQIDALASAAEERGLTPVAWWVGEHHHARLLEALADEPGAEIEGGRLVAIDGLEVKHLTETPARLALWCKEGALDL